MAYHNLKKLVLAASGDNKDRPNLVFSITGSFKCILCS